MSLSGSLKGARAVAGLVVLLAACSGGTSNSVGEREATRAPTAVEPEAAPSRPPECPSPHGGLCLGDLAAGTYRTSWFTPRLSYSVAEGWSNLEDLPGNFLLLPPGRDVDGVDASTADYLGVYSGVGVAAEDCQPMPMPGVGAAPKEFVTALTERTGLVVSAPRRVVVGGLRGLVVDIDAAPRGKGGCVVEAGLRIVPLIFGTGPAELEHAQWDGLRTRLYVLRSGRSNVVVEVSDVEADGRPFEFEAVVDSLEFGAG